jgi:hypothetical protein
MRLRRTTFCKYYEAGSCALGEKCNFAHGVECLRHKPDLRKTRLCTSYMETGQCGAATDCPFAHGDREKRVMRRPYWSEVISREVVEYHSMSSVRSSTKISDPVKRAIEWLHRDSPVEASSKRTIGLVQIRDF